MAQVDSELFTSFQSALDALEKLSVINGSDSAAQLTGNLDSAPDDLKLKILRLSNLETCLALCDSCASFRKLWKSLDKTLVRERVLKRVPWFQLNEGSTGLTTWDQCARTLVARTKQCMKERETILDSKGMVLTKSLELQFTSSLVSHHRVDPTDVTFDHEARQKMKPLFPDAHLHTTGDAYQKGTKLRLENASLELTTLKGTKDNMDRDLLVPNVPIEYRLKTASGIELRHVSPKGKIGIVAENDNLIHVKYSSTKRRYVGYKKKGDEFNQKAIIDTIIHKASHPRDPDGCLIIDPDNLIIIQAKTDYTVPLVNLLPGSAGALIVRWTESDLVSPYLGYIEPNAELRHVIICAVPFFGYGGFMSFDSTHQRFQVTYNGFLYYMHEGRFIQLWVDFGCQKMLKMSPAIRKEIAHDSLAQKTDTRALTALTVLNPMLGTFAFQADLFGNHGIILGDKNQGLDRFVTLRRAHGHIVGDLLTGRTYVSKNPLDDRQISIPYISNKKKKTVGFYSFSTYMSDMLDKELGLMDKAKKPSPASLDLNAKYNRCLENHTTASLDYLVMEPYCDYDPNKQDFYLYPRRVHVGEESFADEHYEFTNIDGDVELEMEEDKATDDEDWDCGHDYGRCSEVYDIESSEGEYDSDRGKSPAQLQSKYKGKLPSVYARRGKKDGRRGRPDTRYNNQEYYKAYHQAHRSRFGYKDDEDIDDYWGSNSNHGPWYL